ncbi:hypothetical protein IQ31_05116 [Sphingobacterium siyangense]|uniref:Uncharacterized protein n=1 Tax=Sphingobacterium siyangense TaxID=459529 RepID=A0A562M6N8_9SPHI|nr:hypothetical protein IQ31_05116 [Sphingobacterium siyangense]
MTYSLLFILFGQNKSTAGNGAKNMNLSPKSIKKGVRKML